MTLTMSPNITIHQAYLVLNGVKGVGPTTAHRILKAFDNNPLKAIECLTSKKTFLMEGVRSTAIDAIRNWSKQFDLSKEETTLVAKQAAFIPFINDDYPFYLKEIYDPPVGLYCLGNYRPQRACVAIVGTRRCTQYGRSVAKRMAGELAKRGFCIVSGLARGIDAAAHEGALEVDGKTAAVLGSGLDVIYPPENKDLYFRIAESGVVMTEYPFGKSGDKYTFPQRNRIVSGMSQAVVVIETDAKGGSMITARMAGEQGRHVFAVPGRIDQASSRGCHQLIREGATLLNSVDDILEELSYLEQMVNRLENPNSKSATSMPSLAGLTEAERTILQFLGDGSLMGVDDLAEASSLAINDVSSALLMLELKQCVVKRLDGTFEVNSPI